MTDRFLGLACMAAAVCMAWAAYGYAAAFSYEPVGPRAFPMLLAGLLAAGGLWLALKPAPDAGQYAGVPLKLVGLCIGAIFLYALGFEKVGFPLATALLTVPVGMAFGGKALKSFGVGAVMGVLLYFMFDRLLDVMLPAGWLAPLLQGL
jgi:putative tricarboxylic transport membrane protein